MKGHLIVGTGGHGRTVLSYLQRSGVSKDLIAFVDLFEKRTRTLFGCPVVGDLVEGIQHPFDSVEVIVAYGGSPYTGNEERQKASKTVVELLGSGFSFATVVDPSAVITSDANIALNVSIGILTVVGTGAMVSEGVILNNSAVIEHDTQIGAYSNISPGTLVMGGTSIGDRVFLGAGAVIRDDISVGDDSVVGMGAVVINDVPARTSVMGNPAEVVERIQEI